MKLDKRGISLVEIIVSVALVSVVLVFLLNLFMKTRSIYNDSKIESQFEMISSTFIRGIGDDIEKYGLLNVEYLNPDEKNAIVLTFNAYRPTRLSERIKKVLRVTKNKNGKYSISYTYDANVTDNIVNVERVTNTVRELPDTGFIDVSEPIKINKLENKIVEIRVPVSNLNDIDYDIVVCGLLVTEE